MINADIVVSGSSRAWVHYNPQAIAATTGLTAFNLGRNGSQTDLQVAVLKTYLQHNAKPRLIIHNLDAYSFATSHEIYDPAQYLPYLGEQPIYDAVRRVYPDAWKWKYVPLYGYVVADLRFTWLLGLKRLVGLTPPEDHIDGFVPRHLTWTTDFEQFRRANPDGVRMPVERDGIRDVEALLALCSENEIPLLFVYSPEFADVQPLQINRPQIFARFQAMARRYGVPFWDFSDSDISRHRDYFYNSQHLNAAGAATFSQELSRRLKTDPVIARAIVK
jgi:hypothetical protein